MTIALQRDNNGVTIIAGGLDTDGTIPTPVKATPSTHIMDVSDGSGGTPSNFGLNAARDGSSVPIVLALSNSDGTTPVALAVNSSGQLLIQST